MGMDQEQRFAQELATELKPQMDEFLSAVGWACEDPFEAWSETMWECVKPQIVDGVSSQEWFAAQEEIVF
jgi:hypothetical protein